MADDILGHEHLDHGKHLHKGGHGHHGHGHGSHGHVLRKHIGVLGGSHHGNSHSVHSAPSHTHEKHSATASHVEHSDHAHSHGKILSKIHESWKLYLFGAVLLLPLLFFTYKSAPALIGAIALIVVNAVIELHKLFTEGMPIDIEILHAGVAFLAALYGFGWAFIVVALGPLVAELIRGHVCEEVIVKSVALLATALAATLLGSEPAQLFIAVIFGLIAQFAGTSVMGIEDSFTNAIARVTTVGVSAYIIFFLLPGLISG